MSYLSTMARRTSVMTAADVAKRFGVPVKGAFEEPKVKKKKSPTVTPGKPVPIPEPAKSNPNALQGPMLEEPPKEGSRGKRRAPTLSRDKPTKAGDPVRARIDNLMQYGSSTFQSSDVESEDQPPEDTSLTGDPNIDTATGEDIRTLAQSIVKTRKDLKLNPENQNPETQNAEEYLERMEESVARRTQALEFELREVEAEQAGMDECDTSFFTPDQAQYYNDYADYLEERKNDLEYEIELLDPQNPMTRKKAPTKKRASSVKSKTRPKTRRVAVKRSPVKARRRKSTSSGRRAPGSPARSR